MPVVFFLPLILTFFLFYRSSVDFGKVNKVKRANTQPVSLAGLLFGPGFRLYVCGGPLIQRFILFLGHPVYSVLLVIFALLVFAGLGSRLSVFIDSPTLRGLKFVLLAVACLLFLSTFYLPRVLSSFQGESLLFRQLLSIFLIAPLGFLMGMPFPLGIRRVGARRSFLVPWAWCANGCASVLGSILPVIIALVWGFQAVFLLAGFLYGLSLVAVWKSS